MGELRVSAFATILILITSFPTLNADDPKGDLSAVQTSMDELILGKWEPAGKRDSYEFIAEFTRDCRLTIVGKSSGETFTRKGTYKFTDDITIEIRLENLGQNQTNSGKIVKLTENELVVRVEGTNQEEKLKRVK
jgi:uncharacterized protein (TIGR03066 family)